MTLDSKDNDDRGHCGSLESKRGYPTSKGAASSLETLDKDCALTRLRLNIINNYLLRLTFQAAKSFRIAADFFL